MNLSFYGAAGEVTGSNFLLQTKNSQILVDCGMFQGRRLAEKSNYEEFSYNPTKIDALLLTHAHLDHCGRIPKLWKDGFRGKIYTTQGTKDLAALIMADAADIMLHEASEDGHEPLYLMVDVANSLMLFETVEYHQKISVTDGVTATFYDAGHILGSASISVEAEGKTLVFSGDIGNQPVPILKPPEPPPTADLVVMETTYGSRTHEPPKDRRVKLRQVIEQTVKRGGTLLIPSFAVERTQEILYELSNMMESNAIPPVPVCLDSPLAIAATKVYYKYPEYFNEEAALIQKNGGDFLSFPTLKITDSVEDSKAIRTIEGPKVIIAGSGMMEGGRILHHAKDYLPDSRNTLLFVGYQAAGTTGRQLYDGVRRIKIFDKMITVKSRVVAIGAYSAHADQPGLKAWFDAIKPTPPQTYLVHGETEESAGFAELIRGKTEAHMPKNGEKITI